MNPSRAKKKTSPQSSKATPTSCTGCLKNLRAKDLDILASEFSLRFDSKSGTFQTSAGGYLTMMVGLIFLGALMTTTVQYFQRNSPVVTVSIEAGPTKSEFNVYYETLWTASGVPVGPRFLQAGERERYATIVWVIEDSFFNTKTDKFEKKLVRIIKSTPCEQVSEPLLRDYVKEIVALPGFERIIICPDFKASGGEAAIQDFKISQDREYQRYRGVSMKVYPCSLENPADCAGHQELLGMRSDYTKNDRVLKSSDFKNPLVKNYYRGIATIDVSFTKILNEDIRKTTIVDDINRFGPPQVKLEFAKNIYGKSDFKMRDRNQLHCSKEQIFSQGGGGCQEYVTYDLYISNEVEIIRRNYKSFTTLLGELGGLLKILTTAVFFFYSIYNYNKMTQAFAGLVFKLDPEVLQAFKASKNKRRKNSETIRASIEGGNGSLHKSRSESTDVETISVEKAVKEIVKKRVSAEGLIDKLNFLELLENVFFTDFEKRLIPLVLLQIEKKNLKNSKKVEKETIQIEARKPELGGSSHIIPPNASRLMGEFSRAPRDGEREKNLRNQKKEKSTLFEEYEAAYKIIKFENFQTTPKQGIRGSIQSYIVESLDTLFYREQQ